MIWLLISLKQKQKKMKAKNTISLLEAPGEAS